MDTHFFAGLTKFKLDAGKQRRDDDFADRFSHNFTTFLLVIFTLVVSARQYIGKPIACWVPTEFTRAQEEYAESVCWVTSTYFLPTQQKSVPESPAERNERKILYYQWVPFILMIQAFLFNFPCIIWRLFNWQSGIHLSSIMEVSCDIEMIRDPDSRKSNIGYVARHIEDSLASQQEYRMGSGVKCRHFLARTCCLWFGKRYGNYLICLYLITKALYIFNVVGQFFLMNRILGTNYTFYGLDLIRDIAEGYVWEESGNFPRITMCDFEIRKLANKHLYTVQCVLPINMFNEKIFIFLWFWFVLVSAISISSFLYWAYKSSFRTNRIHFIRKFLKLRNSMESGEKKISFTFVDAYLRQDGVFILRLIAQNAGELVASEIVDKLWQMFKRRQIVTTTKTCDRHKRSDQEEERAPIGWNIPQDKTRFGAVHDISSHKCLKPVTPSESSSSSNKKTSSSKSSKQFPQVSVIGRPTFLKDRYKDDSAPSNSPPPPLPPPPTSSMMVFTHKTSSSMDSSSSMSKHAEPYIRSRHGRNKPTRCKNVDAEDATSQHPFSGQHRNSAEDTGQKNNPVEEDQGELV